LYGFKHHPAAVLFKKNAAMTVSGMRGQLDGLALRGNIALKNDVAFFQRFRLRKCGKTAYASGKKKKNVFKRAHMPVFKKR
jgi:hypothetical protein